MKCYYIGILWLLLFFEFSSSLVEPFSPMLFGAVSAAASSALLMLGEIAGLTSLRCKFGLLECCNEQFIHANMTSFKLDMKKNLYGQHIALQTVYKAVKSHVTNPHPAKPLVMSFHGWTGGGKNFVARMIVRNMYKKAEKSSFVHIFNAEVHFKDSEKVTVYKDQLQNWISGNVSRCGQSIFVFDEMDHMPEGLIDALKPFLEPQPSFHGVDYRKSIFIFLSNIGGGDVVEHCLNVWKEGKARERITLSEMQSVLTKSAFNQKSGLRLSDVVQKNLVDHFVPFLPLEREHVKDCIRDEIKRVYPDFNLYRNDEVISKVMDELLWFPESNQLYSTSGCKKVSQKVALVVHDELSI